MAEGDRRENVVPKNTLTLSCDSLWTSAVSTEITGMACCVYGKHCGIGTLYGNYHLRRYELIKLKSPVLRGVSVCLSVIEVTVKAEESFVLSVGDNRVK